MRLLGERRPELIVLDLILPDADGTELVRWMRKQPELATVPLAVYTEKDLTDELRESLQLGPERPLHQVALLKPEELARGRWTWSADRGDRRRRRREAPRSPSPSGARR